MKHLSDYIKENGSGDVPGMGPVTHPDVANSPADTHSPEYKHGSGDIPGTVKKKKKRAKASLPFMQQALDDISDALDHKKQ